MADQIVNYYEVLGVPRNASQAEIKNAYRNLAKERHPDRAGGSEIEFNRLQEANAVLSDPNRRSQHDEALDLAHAADQLASLELDFGSLDDEVSSKRREREARESTGPGLGERLRNRFRKEEAPDVGGPGRSRNSASRREARWYEPQDFDPEPANWKTGAFSFFGALVAFLVVGQIGLWATAPLPPDFAALWAPALAPLMPILYTLTGLLAAYFAYRAAGWVGLALVFVAALVVRGSDGPAGSLQFAAVGILLLLIVIYLGNRRNEATRRRR